MDKKQLLKSLFIGYINTTKLFDDEEVDECELNTQAGAIMVSIEQLSADIGPPVGTTLEILDMLEYYFGVTVNEKGYKVLNPKIGYLWGDGIDMEGIRKICIAAEAAGWDIGTLVFGMGGTLHQKVNRDTQNCAFKSSFQIAGGIEKMIFKNPLDQSKRSKRGKLALLRIDNEYVTYEACAGHVAGDLLTPVFLNGELINEYTFAECKSNINN